MSLKRAVMGLVGWLLTAGWAAGVAPPARERTDLYGDPLPPGALMRLGTVRFRAGWPVYHLAFSPDGRAIASAEGDDVVVWDAATGRPLRRLRGLEGPRPVAYSPCGRLLASGDRAGAVRLWDAQAGRTVGQFAFDEGEEVDAITFSPGGTMLAVSVSRVDAGKRSGHVSLWEVATRKKLRPLRGCSYADESLTFSPDGKHVATSGSGEANGLRLWEVASGKMLHEYGSRADPVSHGIFTADGKSLVTGGQKAVRFWSVTTGKEVRPLRCGEGGITVAGLSSDGKTVVTREGGYEDSQVVRLRDLATGREKQCFTCRGMYVQAVALSPDGKRLAMGGSEALCTGKIRVWDSATGKELLPLEEHIGGILAVAYAPGSRQLATAGVDRTVRLWDVVTGRQVGRLDGDKLFWSVTFTPDGKTLVTGGGFQERPLRLWRLPGLKPVRRFGTTGHLLLTPDGKRLVNEVEDEVIVWDVGTGRERRRFSLGGGDRYCSTLTADGTALVSASDDITLWDLTTGKVRRSIKPSPAISSFPVRKTAFSPDGRTLAAGTADGVICLWDARTGKLLRQLTERMYGMGSVYYTYALAFSPDGRTLASATRALGDDEADVRLWEVLTGRERRGFRGHRGPMERVMSLAFGLDGRSLASAGADSTVLIWDMRLGARPRPSAARPAARLPGLWANLADEDAARAYEAQDELAAWGDEAVAFLRRRLPPVPAAEAKALARWVADLDDDDFEMRQRATAELARRGEAAEPALREALKSRSPEVRRRAAKLLARLGHKNGDWLRGLRAVEVLEHVGTPEARKALGRLAAGAPEARLTREAKAALGRGVEGKTEKSK